MVSIAEFFGHSGRRLWIVALTTVAAVLVTLVYALGTHAGYRAVSSVTVVLPDDTAPTGQVVNQAVENLLSGVASRQLAEIVSEETGVPIGSVRDALSSRRLGSGNVIEIIAEADSSDTATALATSAALAAMRLQTLSEVGVAREGVTLARQLSDDAQAKLTALIAELGIADPDAELDALTIRLREARQQLAAATLEVQRDELAGAGTATAYIVRDTERAIEALLPDVLHYRALVLERDAAFERMSLATSRQLEADAISAVASAELVAPAGQAVAISLRQQLAKAVIAAAVFGMALGIGVLALMEVVGSREKAESPTSRPEKAIPTAD